MRTNFKSFLKATIIVAMTFFNFTMLLPQQVSAQGQGQWISNGSTIVYTNRKVGVKTNLPTKDFDVNGSFRSINAFVDSVLNVWQLIVAGNVSVGGTLNVGQFSLNDNNIISSSGNINFGNSNLTTIGNVNAANILNLQSTVDNQQTKIDSLQSVINNIHSSQWQNNDTNIFFNNGWVGIGTNVPAVKLDVWGNQRITKNLFVGGEVIVSEKFSARTVATDTMRAEKQLFVNHNLKLGSDSGSVNSDIASKVELLKIQSDPASVFDVAISVNDSSKVGIGTKYPSEKLSVEGNVSVNGNINTTGNISTNSINASNMNVTGQTSFDSLKVTNKIRTSRITNLPGDSLIHFGDSSIVINTNGNLIYTTPGSNLYIQCGLNLSQNATIINGTRGNVGIGTSFPVSKLNVSEAKSNIYSPTAAPIPSLLLDNFNNSQTNSQYFSIGFRAKGIIGGNTAVGYINLVQPDRFQKNGDFTFTLRNVTGNYNEIMRINSEGTVGIGMLTPTSKLYIKSDSTKTGLIVETSFDSTSHGYGIIANVGTTGDNTIAFAVKKDTTNNFIVYGNGHVFARDVIVKLGYLGDFVFNDDYKLMTIYELENYIKQNHHLPKIPSAKEVKENGMNVGEFQNLVLQKTEEQALYIISLQKQIDELKIIIQNLKN